MKGILGIKLGMTQIFEEDGKVVPVTVVKAGPCLVVQRKSEQSDGYEAIQLGLVEDQPPRKVTQPMRGHFDKAGVTPTRRLMEFRTNAEDPAQAGDEPHRCRCPASCRPGNRVGPGSCRYGFPQPPG